MKKDFKMVVLAGKGNSTWVLLNAIKSEFTIDKVFIEDSPSAYRIWWRRICRFGIFAASGQMLFLLYYVIQRCLCKNRIDNILKNANRVCLHDHDMEMVDSVNSFRVCSVLREMNPDVVIVNGSRILSENVLMSCNAVFLNMHAGITPMYRGVHGGYWALANNDPEHCGVTVHLVDRGVDTGGILYQARIEPTPEDCFATYPSLQLVAGIPLMMQAIRDASGGNLRIQPSHGVSKQYYHPTLWNYLVRRWRSKAR